MPRGPAHLPGVSGQSPNPSAIGVPFWSLLDDGSALLSLKPGWDGHDGKVISRDALRFMHHVLEQVFLTSPQLPEPALVPLSYGGIQAEWYTEKADLEIEVESPGHFLWYFHDRQSGIEDEGEGTTDFTLLQELAARI
ncbi:MAG: hypothetical protein H7840_05385 [Alphaproteobacteria bacterium]